MTTGTGKEYRLGLDMGTNSIGWAAVSLDENGEPCGVLDMGVRIFPDGRKSTDGTSNAVDRRLARGQRRRRDRYLKRRGGLLHALVEFGLMPRDEVERKALEKRDPWVLRARALDHPLEPHALGRALFHLNQRRGFKSNRKTGGEDDEKEAKKTRAEINALRSRIEESGARTLGEFLARRNEIDEAVRARPDRNLYPDRAMYEAEFDAIRAAQELHHDLTAEQWDGLRSTIFFQRPLQPVEVGLCQLEDGEKRAPKALPIVQEFRMLQEVNNVKLRVGIDPERPLDERERGRAMNRLRSGKDIKLSEGRDNKPAKPTRDLGLPSGAVFNLARGGRKSVEGDATAKRLIKAQGRNGRELFGSRWLSLSLDERNDIVCFMLEAEDPEAVRRKAKDEWGLEDAQADVVANISLPDGYSNLSEKAIRNLLPHLRKGQVYSDAAKNAGYHHSDFRSGEARERLPYYGEVLTREVVGANREKAPEKDGEPARYGRIGNPTVHIGLNQLRRIVNGLIEAYGKPEEIVVELGRDLKMNREQKLNYQRQQREGGERNERLASDLESAEVPVTSDALRKLRLWEEQGPPHARICPYTGRNLSFEMVVSAATEVDHILPFSKTLDDSMANKIVCVTAANRYKGDRSPYEAFGHNPGEYDYESILERAAKLPPNKRWRFDQDAMDRFKDDDGFLDRQLNETRHLSRTARSYLSNLYDEKSEHRQRVYVTPGRMTALLRRGWGLEGILRVNEDGEVVGKQRDDHRHHAIDAFVVANTTRGMLQRVAQAAASGHDAEEKLAKVAGQASPWGGFDREELRPFLDSMVVSYKPDHATPGKEGRTTGKLHNETAYGLIEWSEDGPSKVVVRKNLDKLKRSDLEPVKDSTPRKGVRDITLRAALLELWDKVGCKADEFAEQAATKGVLVNGRRQTVRRVRVVDEQRVIPIRHGPEKRHSKGYMPGGNEFADVWRMRDGSWRMIVVPRFYANQRDFDIENFRPLTTRGKYKGKPDPVAKPIIRLHIDDMGAIGEVQDRRIVRVRKITDAKQGAFAVLDDHNEANVADRVGKDMRENRYSARQLQALGFRKISVDAIGRVQDPGPPKQ